MPANIPASKHKRVVVIGGGFGGINLAKKLRKVDVQMVMVDRNNFHTFQPLMYQVATAGLDIASIAYPLRKFLREEDDYHFRMTDVTAVLPNENKILTNIGDITYDYLVIATGATTNYFRMGDVERNALPLKSLAEAIDMRNHILLNFEKLLRVTDPTEEEALMTYVIAGGGPTGVELAGALSELRNKVLPKDYPELDLQKMKIIIVDMADRVLGAMSEYASKKALKALKDFDVEVRLGEGVKSYDGNIVTLTTGNTIRTANLIWAAGVMGDMIEGFDKEKIARGNRIKVDQYNRVEGYENIFAIGDIAQQENEGFEHGLPMLAPVAIQQGKHLAKNIDNLVSGKKLEPFKYFDKGSLATIGRKKAVADLPGNIHFGGFIAWVAWLFVHVLFLVGFRNKGTVLTDWFWNYVTYDRRVRLIVRPFCKDIMAEHLKKPVPVKEKSASV